MLFVLLGIFIVVAIIGTVICNDALIIVGCLVGTVLAVATVICFACYNDIKATADKQIAVLEQRNDEVIAQIEPLVKQYLEYETNTFKDLKPSADKIIAIAQYPNLKGNEFVQTQIKVILDNQEKITRLKLEKAGLNAYKLWIFMGE